MNRGNKFISSELLIVEADRAGWRVNNILTDNQKLPQSNPKQLEKWKLAEATRNAIELNLRRIAQRPVDSTILDIARNIPNTVKTLDAIHLATASVLNHELGAGQLTALMTFDEKMREISESLGIPAPDPVGLSVFA